MSESPHTCHWCGQMGVACMCHDSPPDRWKFVVSVPQGFIEGVKVSGALAIVGALALLVLMVVAN